MNRVETCDSVGGQNNRLLNTWRRCPFQPFTSRPLISMLNASHIRVLCVSIILSFRMSTPTINIDMRGSGGARRHALRTYRLFCPSTGGPSLSKKSVNRSRFWHVMVTPLSVWAYFFGQMSHLSTSGPTFFEKSQMPSRFQ